MLLKSIVLFALFSAKNFEKYAFFELDQIGKNHAQDTEKPFKIYNYSIETMICVIFTHVATEKIDKKNLIPTQISPIYNFIKD